MFLRYELKAQAGWVGSREVLHLRGVARGGLLPLGGPRDASGRAVIIGTAPVCPGFMRLLKEDTAVLP